MVAAILLAYAVGVGTLGARMLAPAVLALALGRVPHA